MERKISAYLSCSIIFIVLLVLAVNLTAEQYAGTTLRLLMVDGPFERILKKYFPEFEQQTGIKIEMDASTDPIFLQRADLELASGSGAYNVLRDMFIMAARWQRAGWLTPLKQFIDDPKLTNKAELDIDDFASGSMFPFRYKDDIYALPMQTGCMIMTYRKDIFQKFGIVKPPETFEELLDVCAKIHTPEVAAIILRAGPTATGAGVSWPSFLMGYGGNFFVDPPRDMTPTLNSSQAIRAAEIFATLLQNHSVPGVGAFEFADVITTFQQGRAAIWFDDLIVLSAVMDTKKSLVHDKVGFAPIPRGPAGRFPLVATHGLAIPIAAKSKEAAWLFIKWATSKSVMRHVALDNPFPSITRLSIFRDLDYKKKYNWGGADIGALEEQAIADSRMAYRVVPEFKPIGDRVAIAIGQILSRQKSAKEAMEECNRDVIAILEKAGHKIRKE